MNSSPEAKPHFPSSPQDPTLALLPCPGLTLYHGASHFPSGLLIAPSHSAWASYCPSCPSGLSPVLLPCSHPGRSWEGKGEGPCCSQGRQGSPAMWLRGEPRLSQSWILGGRSSMATATSPQGDAAYSVTEPITQHRGSGILTALVVFFN